MNILSRVTRLERRQVQVADEALCNCHRRLAPVAFDYRRAIMDLMPLGLAPDSGEREEEDVPRCVVCGRPRTIRIVTAPYGALQSLEDRVGGGD